MADPILTVLNGKSSVGTLKQEVGKLKKSKTAGADAATIKSVQTKVDALIASLSPALGSLEKIVKEIDELQAKKKALQTKVDAFNQGRAKIQTAGKAAFETLNTARGKGSKEDQAAIAKLFSVSVLYVNGVPAVSLD